MSAGRARSSRRGIGGAGSFGSHAASREDAWANISSAAVSSSATATQRSPDSWPSAAANPPAIAPSSEYPTIRPRWYGTRAAPASRRSPPPDSDRSAPAAACASTKGPHMAPQWVAPPANPARNSPPISAGRPAGPRAARSCRQSASIGLGYPAPAPPSLRWRKPGSIRVRAS